MVNYVNLLGADDSDDDEKECSKCNESSPATTEFFYRLTSSYDGLSYWCKACSDAYTRRRREQRRTLRRLKNERYNVFAPYVVL